MAVARHPLHRRPRHRRPRSVTQPVGAVLLGVMLLAFGLAALLPNSAAPAAAASAAASLPAATRSTEPAAGLVSHAEQERASRARSLTALGLAAQAEPSPAPVPSPAAPSPVPPVDVLPGCTASPVTQGFANGRLPAGALCALPGRSGHALRADAARAFVRLDNAYRASSGTRLCLTDSYRTLAAQQTLARQKPRLAGRPGTSEHGWGLAVDLACGAQSFTGAAHRWLVAHAGDYGWYLPGWAQRDGSKPEPWHWEWRD